MAYSPIEKFKRDLAQHQVKIRFFAVGIWNTFFGYLVFYLSDTLFTHVFQKRYFAYMSALMFAQVLAIINAYYFHKHITFKSRVKDFDLVKEFFRFSMTYAFIFCINLILLPIFVEVFHFTPKISGVILIFASTVISYLGHSRFSFKRAE
jgi:putative flippase GtrA